MVNSSARAGNALLLAQGYQEARQLVVGQCGVMLDLAHLAASGQQLVDMAAPPRRVVSGSISAHLGPIEYRLNAPA
jgi:hypothetical protein